MQSVFEGLILISQGSILGIEIEIFRSWKSQRKSLQKGKDRSLPLKDLSLKEYSLHDFSFCKDWSLVNEGLILESQRIDHCSWISDLLSSNGHFSPCSLVWFLLNSSLILGSMVILFWCFHFPHDSLFVLTECHNGVPFDLVDHKYKRSRHQSFLYGCDRSLGRHDSKLKS